MNEVDPGTVLVAGFGPYQLELAQLFASQGWTTTLYLPYGWTGEPDEAPAPGIEVLEDLRDSGRTFDVCLAALNGPEDEREVTILELTQALEEDGLLLVSALGHTVTEVASWSALPERVVGFALLPPVEEAPLVEVASALQSTPALVERAEELFRSLGKEVERVRDVPGLVLARLVALLANEAAFAVQEGVSTPREIDAAMRLGTRYPRGPLEWADRIGLDVVYDVLAGVHDHTGEERYRPCPLLRQLVLAGHLGIQTGRGFHTYDDGGGERNPSPVVIWSRD